MLVEFNGRHDKLIYVNSKNVQGVMLNNSIGGGVEWTDIYCNGVTFSVIDTPEEVAEKLNNCPGMFFSLTDGKKIA